MKRHPPHILVLYDLPEKTSGHDVADYLLKHTERPTERDVCHTIKKLGFQLSICGVFDDVSEITRAINDKSPDLIFNLCETFLGDRAYEGHVAGLVEMCGVPMTGSKVGALAICKDKAITKKILSFDGIRVPEFQVLSQYSNDTPNLKTYPAIVKPLNKEASEGIAQASVVYDIKSCAERISYIHEKLNTDAIVEEFIHGREIYVAVIEIDGEPQALTPRELFMRELADNQVMVATYQAKWNNSYRKKWGIKTGKHRSLDAKTLAKLKADSVCIFKSLGLTGYARMDWRLDESGEPVFLEANPNPALASDDDLAQSAKLSGISYHELILKIISAAYVSDATNQVKLSLG